MVAVSQAVSHPCGTLLLSWVSWHPGIVCGWSLNTSGLTLVLSSSRDAAAWLLQGWEVLTCRKSCLVWSVYLTPKGSLNILKQGLSCAQMCRFSIGSLSRFSRALKLRKTSHTFKRGFVHSVCSANWGSAANPFPDLWELKPLLGLWLLGCILWLLPEVLASLGDGSGSWILKNCFWFVPMS